MPKIPKKIKDRKFKTLKQKGRRMQVAESKRFFCPKCKAVHHFDSRSGCHNDNCKYTGYLKEQADAKDR